MQKVFCVYFLTNKPKGVIYIGVTSDLQKRIYEHKNSIKSGFVSKYKLYKLVKYEVFDSAEYAIQNEKKLKNLSRAKKIEIIEKDNPTWQDLSFEVLS